MLIEKESTSRQEKAAGKSPDQVGVGKFEPGESGCPDQVIGENADPHRLPGNAHHYAEGCRSNNHPAVEEGKVRGHKGDMRGDPGHGWCVP